MTLNMTRDAASTDSARSGWSPATVTVWAISRRARGPLSRGATDATVMVALGDGTPAFELLMRNVSPAGFAAHLFVVGAEIPAWVDPADHSAVVLDWDRAAERDVDRARLASSTLLPEPSEIADVVPWALFIAVQRAIVARGISDEFHSYFAESLGVPYGAWPAAHDRWMARVTHNWTLGVDYGRAMGDVAVGSR